MTLSFGEWLSKFRSSLVHTYCRDKQHKRIFSGRWILTAIYKSIRPSIPKTWIFKSVVFLWLITRRPMQEYGVCGNVATCTLNLGASCGSSCVCATTATTRRKERFLPIEETGFDNVTAGDRTVQSRSDQKTDRTAPALRLSSHQICLL